MSIDLKQLVLDDIDRLGYEASAAKYATHRNTVINWAKGRNPPSADAIQMAYNEKVGTCTIQQEMAVWQGKKLIIAMPVHRTIEPATVHTLMGNISRFGPDRIGFTLTQGITLLEDARNTLAERVLQTDAERVLFLDDDLVMPFGSAPHFQGYYGVNVPEKFASRVLINELWNADKDIVGALYFGRNAQGVAQYSEAFQSKDEDKRAHALDFDGLQETKWVATGAMMVKRQVFETIKAKAPELFPTIVPRQQSLPTGWFNRLNADAGEDVSFCHRARSCGFQVYVHRGVVCGHIGSQIYGPHNTTGRV